MVHGRRPAVRTTPGIRAGQHLGSLQRPVPDHPGRLSRFRQRLGPSRPGRRGVFERQQHLRNDVRLGRLQQLHPRQRLGLRHDPPVQGRERRGHGELLPDLRRTALLRPRKRLLGLHHRHALFQFRPLERRGFEHHLAELLPLLGDPRPLHGRHRRPRLRRAVRLFGHGIPDLGLGREQAGSHGLDAERPGNLRNAFGIVEHGQKRLGPALLLRTCQLRLQKPLPVRGESPRRRLLALRQQQPLRHLPLVLGRMENPRGTFHGGDRRLALEPQAARIVGQGRQQPGHRQLCLAGGLRHAERRGGRVRLERALHLLAEQRRPQVGNHRHNRHRPRHGLLRQPAHGGDRLLPQEHHGHPLHPDDLHDDGRGVGRALEPGQRGEQGRRAGAELEKPHRQGFQLLRRGEFLVQQKPGHQVQGRSGQNVDRRGLHQQPLRRHGRLRQRQAVRGARSGRALPPEALQGQRTRLQGRRRRRQRRTEGRHDPHAAGFRMGAGSSTRAWRASSGRGSTSRR